MQITKAVFVKSASRMQECPPSEVPEFAFIWRSNVGKSSLINMLCNNNSLAKTSITPGKTQLMNFYLINDICHFVDLPGYGYASSSFQDRAYWINMTQKFFTERARLKKVFVLIDGSLPTQKIDLQFLQTVDEEHIPFAIIVTKIDKASQKETSLYIKALKEKVQNFLQVPKIFLSSSKKRSGVKEILGYVEGMIIDL